MIRNVDAYRVEVLRLCPGILVQECPFPGHLFSGCSTLGEHPCSMLSGIISQKSPIIRVNSKSGQSILMRVHAQKGGLWSEGT